MTDDVFGDLPLSFMCDASGNIVRELPSYLVPMA